MKIALANGRGMALVDGADAPAVLRHKWSLRDGRYAGAWIGGRIVLMHRFIMGLAHGDAREVDHVDNARKLDNRRSNLRIVTKAQNAQNLSPRRAGSSRHRGVSYAARERQWRAVAGLDHRQVHIGYFDTEGEAAAAAANWRRQHMPFAME